ncbi:ABC1 family protein [Aeromicrobium marinum DSM 15272]|uniref:ABC1 family protein n=1 Tax=Aeromicrobium marinum DSM 15272 TaxID=585531 RepID=E2SCI1_9ACTN|nr:AarF/UbiB family protein [Aeromicrobium marinum]EFQ82934.1 ABC1 family protein [Aeromicrobium marinum DSM 15272]
MSDLLSADVPPPLPRIDDLIRGSDRLAAVPGLTEQALRWHHEAVAGRAAVARDARRLASPRLWPDTIASLLTTGWRLAGVAAPGAPFQLLAVASAAVGLRVEPPEAGAATIERVQRLVRAGGPAYVKLGQFVATGDGLVPDEWVRAFAWCRDEAPQLEPGVARAVIDRELGLAQDRLAWFDDAPLAAGSIGQVHRGRLTDGTEVVVKVLRPGLRRRFRTDIETLALASAAAERLHPAARSANLTGFVELFAQLALEELDFRLEAANLVDSSAVLEAMGAHHMLAPRPVPGMVTEKVLVMEYLPGASYARLDRTAALDGDVLLGTGIRGVVEATLRYGVFHGDLHAGNVLIDASTGSFSLVDFGIAGRLDAAQRAGLVQYLAAWAANDAAGQIEAMQAFGAIDRDVPTGTLVAELQAELDLLQERARGQVTFDQLGVTLGRLLQVLARNGFRMPKDLVLFFKNLLYLSGFAAAVAPDADVLAVVQDILLDLLATV